MKNKLLCAFLLLVTACSTANASNIIYSYVNSSGTGDVGFIDTEKLVANPGCIGDRSFSNRIYASGYTKNGNSYVIIAEHPSSPTTEANNTDTAFIYNYNGYDEWTFSKSFEMTGALNVREITIAPTGESLYAVAYGLDSETFHSGVFEYLLDGLKLRNSNIYNPGIQGAVIHGEDLVTGGNYDVNILFSVKSGDVWAESHISRYWGELGQARGIKLKPQAVDFKWAKGGLVVACRGNGGVSGEVSLETRTVVSTDNSGGAIGEVLSVGNDGYNGEYFIALSNDIERLYRCLDNSTHALSDTSLDVTPSSASDASLMSDTRKILWDSSTKLAFVMAGDKIIVIDGSSESDTGLIIKATFSSSDLGGYPLSISFIKESSTSKSSSNSSCNAPYFGLIALAVPVAFKFKIFKRKNKK